MNIIIRMAGEADAPAIALFSRESFSDTYARYNSPENMSAYMDGAFNVAALEKEVTAPGNSFLVAFEQQHLLGYLKLAEGNPPTAIAGENAIEIARIYVHRTAIGKGLGQKLLDAGLELAKEKHNEQVWLGVWENNERAINFYKRNGFIRFGEHPFILGDELQNDWLMKRKI